MPWVAWFILFLVGLALAASMIVLPVWSIRQYGATSGSDLWGPMLAILIGLTTMTISGIFVFMTFRIDRGTKLTAEWKAKEVAAKTVEEIVRKVVGRKLAGVRANIDQQFSDATSELAKMKTNLSNTRERIGRRFEKLEETIEEQFVEVKKQIEKSFFDADIEKLIKEAVDGHF